MSDSTSSSLARMLGVLDLFGESVQTLTAEAISDALGVSRPTGYRYIRILLNADLLQHAGNAAYALGPKIVMLDHYIRATDPVLHAARPLMRALADQTGFDCITSGWFSNQVLDTHREYGAEPADLPVYDRGKTRSLFAGAGPKLVLASLPTIQLRRLFDTHHKEVRAAGLPVEWPAFRKYYAGIRHAGYYQSHGEGHPQYAAVGAPIVNPKDGLWYALVVVFNKSRLSIVDTDKLIELTLETARAISARVTQQTRIPLPNRHVA